MKRANNVWDDKRGIWQPRISEEMVLKEIVTRLWFQAKIKVVRINCAVGGKVRPNEPGIPDLIGWIPHRPFAVGCSRGACASTIIEIPPTPLYIEVKRPGGARRPAQIRFIEEARSAGCVAFFAESFDDCIKELRAHGLELV